MAMADGIVGRTGWACRWAELLREGRVQDFVAQWVRGEQIAFYEPVSK